MEEVPSLLSELKLVSIAEYHQHKKKKCKHRESVHELQHTLLGSFHGAVRLTSWSLPESHHSGHQS